MLAFVHEQVRHERDGTREALEALHRQLELAHRAAGRFRSNLLNRDEAITELNRETNGSETNRYAGLFVADALSALRLRHGNEISEQLLHEVSHQHIASVIRGGRFFRWSAQSILAIWSSPEGLTNLNSAIARSCQAPFDCHAFVGTRTATFRISLRWAIWNVQAGVADLTRAFDEFSRGTDTK